MLISLLLSISAALAQADSGGSCLAMRALSAPCAEEFQGLQLERCRVCRERQPCMAALSTPGEIPFCLAYAEGESCGYFEAGRDREWCEVARGGEPCAQALSDEADREMCRRGYAPYFHVFWSR